MRGDRRFVALTAGAASCSFVATVLRAPTPIMATLAFALLASFGYVWITVILRGRAPALELISVATGLVLATPVIGGVLLQEAGIPLNRVAWSSLFVVLTYIGDVVLAVRYRGQVPEQDYRHDYQALPQQHPDGMGRTRPAIRRGDPAAGPALRAAGRMNSRPTERTKRRRHVSPWQATACGLAVVIAGGAVWIAQAGATSQHYPGDTELWLSSINHSTSAYNLGVSNDEGKTEKYRVNLLRKGHVSKTWNITLTAGQTWEKDIKITGDTRADLYRQPDLSQPYRYVDTAS
jgi:hypothetical protein